MATKSQRHERIARLVHDHAIAHIDADLRWLDAAAARLVTTAQGARP